MKQEIKQYRFYGDSANNISSNLKSTALINGTFLKENEHIVSLGIQTIPGVKFYVNYSINPVIIDQSGIFNLDLRNNIYIYNLRFDSDSINSILDSQNGYIILDLIVEKEE